MRQAVLVFLLSTIAGAFGGLIFELINLKGNWEVNHKPTEDELLQSYPMLLPIMFTIGVVGRVLLSTATNKK